MLQLLKYTQEVIIEDVVPHPAFLITRYLVSVELREGESLATDGVWQRMEFGNGWSLATDGVWQRMDMHLAILYRASFLARTT
ncbi:MAG: hypothetical protein WBF90_22845 [Rivularia sp. (in: cyanobacteria)]